MPGFVAWAFIRESPTRTLEELLTQRRVPFSAAVSMALSGEIAGPRGHRCEFLAVETRFRREEYRPISCSY